MSEYQYYEFQAIDRPLTEEEMRKLRACSTRARITPTSFVNHYDWGDFKGDEDTWMEEYFDAFLYLANWGTRVVKLRLPSALLPLKTARQYCTGISAFVRQKAGRVVVTLSFGGDPEDGWDTGEGWLASLVSIRDELARGDLRALYLGWLLCAQEGECDDDDLEPPVPPGLASLSASLDSLVEFLRIDPHLLSAASVASANIEKEPPDRTALAAWVAALPSREKDKMLVHLMRGEEACLGRDLLARFEREQSSGAAERQGPARRTVADLLRAAEKQRQIAAEKAAKERAHQEREAKVARAKHLDGLVGREATLWAKVERLIGAKQPKSYDQAVKLLVDLCDLAARKGGGDFRQRLDALRAVHSRKITLLGKLEKVGL